jgi:hypothetical protein
MMCLKYVLTLGINEDATASMKGVGLFIIYARSALAVHLQWSEGPERMKEIATILKGHGPLNRSDFHSANLREPPEWFDRLTMTS